ncbi:hypothetical protein RUM43_006112 [Polyplax serrata]|uniref:WD repeat-containing protein 18 n=1 Tax=Polyplax serrata TaxID=468196 RepID=A0AAN8P0X7_POLSC
MTDCLEVLFVSDSSGKQKTANCFNPKVGTTLMTYRGSGAPKRCVSLIGNDYLVSADVNKPILNIWPLNSQEPMQELRMVIAGKPSALCVSPDGHYCVAGIDGKIYIWHISSGSLLNVISRHYQAVNKICFTDDSSYFVTAGEDGLVLVWRVADVVAKQFGNVFRLNSSQVAPVYSFSDHSLPVNDAFVGCGSLKARLFTISSDQTCKIYCLSSGKLLLSIVFSHVLTAVTVNDIETQLFVGTASGKIQFFHLDSYPRSLEYHVPDDINESATLTGHTKSVTCLSISLDGVTLASGSDDEKVFLWNVPSRQLIRSFDMKGPVTNVFFSIASSNIFLEKFKPLMVVSKFEKTSSAGDKNISVNVRINKTIEPLSLVSEFETPKQEVREFVEKEEEKVTSLKDQISTLKNINKELYQFAMNKILKNPLTIGMNDNGTED